MKIAYCGPISLSLLGNLFPRHTKLPNGYNYPFGAYLVQELVQRGHYVTVVSCTFGISESFICSGKNIELRIVPRRKPQRFVWDFYRQERHMMRDQILAADPDIIHAQWCYEFAHAAIESPFPHLVTIRDAPWRVFRYFCTPYRFYRLIYGEWVLKQSKNLSAVSSHVAKAAVLIKSRRKKIAIVPNGLSSASFLPQKKEYSDANESKRIFVSVAAWNPLKNTPTLLKAFKIYREHQPNTELFLIGPKLGAGEQAEKWAQKKELDLNVRFLGHRPHGEIIKILRTKADVFLHASMEESFCMAILEAMAQGLPVVAFDRSGAVPWLLDYGNAGILTPEKSASAFAKSILSLTSDPERIKEISDAAYRRAREHFNLSDIVARYEALYFKAISNT